MGLFGGSSSASSSSTNNSSTWDSQEIQDLVNSMGYAINYSNETLDPMNQYMQNFLDYELNPERFNTAKNLAGKGSKIWNQGVNDFNKLRGLTPEDIGNAWMGGVSKIYGKASGFMDQQDQAIEDQVSVQMGQEFAQNAETMNAGGAVAGSSASNNSAMGIMSAGAQSMETQESKVAANILNAAARVTGKGITTGLRSASNLVSGELGLGGAFAKAAAASGKSAASNYWNAALVEQGYEQKASNVARKNSMINNNTALMTDVAMLSALLQAAGVDTSSTTSGSSSVSSGGLL